MLLALDGLMTQFVVTPTIAGPHYAALPLLLHFSTRGIRPVVAVALKTVLDGLSQRHRHRRLCCAIGRAIEDEVKAGRIARHDADVLRVLRRYEGRNGVIAPSTLRSLKLDHGAWSTTDRFEIGALLLDLIVKQTGLVRLVNQTVRGRNVLMVEPTEGAVALIMATPEHRARPAAGARLSPPEPWQDRRGLVSRRDGMGLEYLDGAELGPTLQVVNRLQGQAVTVDPVMAQLQAEAWGANIRGLFSVSRDPEQPPPRPETGEDREGWAKWRQAARKAWAEERLNSGARRKIQEAISQGLELAGRPLWFSYSLDFRGRIYTANRVITHQGPDHEKALIQFHQGKPCDVDGAEWILKAAAGHWGLSRASWQERLQWGRDNTDRLVAIAEAPLDRVELWRDAKDPWQLLQMARAWAQWLADPNAPITAPIRLDQTTSGLGIAAALVRDERLAREANLIGSTRHDIYIGVAERLRARLQLALETATPSRQRWAQQWLELGIDRALVKEPVMASIYGGQHRSTFDVLADHLLERVELRGASDYDYVIVKPARYAATVLRDLLQEPLAPLLSLKTWLEGVSNRVVRQQKPVQWTAPNGFPVLMAGKQKPNAPAHTLLHGSQGWHTGDSERRRQELSARATKRSITANLVHSFDAALAHALICRAEDAGVEVLPNHDCFAVIPAEASWLHRTVHSELRTLYLPDWLDEISQEIASHSGVSGLPSPPMAGTLNPGAIGQNPYCFS